MQIDVNGKFYPAFTSDRKRYSEKDRACIQRTVERLLTSKTNEAKPGMLLGKIQSGKTKTFLGSIALGFDNGYEIAIILTKGTKALAKQTIQRVRRDFATFYAEDKLQIFDIMSVPPSLTGYELGQKMVLVVKKQQKSEKGVMPYLLPFWA